MVEYRKFVHKKYGKLYAAVVVRVGKAARLTHRYFRSASEALEYGRRVEGRYERMRAWLIGAGREG